MQVRLCPDHHKYFIGDRRLTAVSRVIHAMMPTDYSAVSPLVLENARLKGKFIDGYFSDWLESPQSMLGLDDFRAQVEPHFSGDDYATPQKHANDAMQRLDMLLGWWQKQGYQHKAVQSIVYSEADGIAGMFDIATEDKIIDLKCVSSLQPAYSLQLGAYLSYDPQKFPLRDAAILHVTKERVKLVAYDAKKCKRQWQDCVGWYKTMMELRPKTAE
jgi:hypothetical protein